jgi:hypothetical protein
VISVGAREAPGLIGLGQAKRLDIFATPCGHTPSYKWYCAAVRCKVT